MNPKATQPLTSLTIHPSAEQGDAPSGSLPRHWCNACAKATWVVTPDEAAEIASISPSCYRRRAGQAVTLRNIHYVTTSTGTTLICLKSLFLCLFSVCEAAA